MHENARVNISKPERSNHFNAMPQRQSHNHLFYPIWIDRDWIQRAREQCHRQQDDVDETHLLVSLKVRGHGHSK